jgi:hypothetical protein
MAAVQLVLVLVPHLLWGPVGTLVSRQMLPINRSSASRSAAKGTSINQSAQPG